jgi:hypothetical protein
VSELRELTDRYPLREGLWAQLMTALYRCGRRADALEAFTRARTRLVEELGIEPAAELQQLQRATLTSDPALAAVPAPVRPETLAKPSQLPVDVGDSSAVPTWSSRWRPSSPPIGESRSWRSRGRRGWARPPWRCTPPTG